MGIYVVAMSDSGVLGGFNKSGGTCAEMSVVANWDWFSHMRCYGWKEIHFRQGLVRLATSHLRPESRC